MLDVPPLNHPKWNTILDERKGKRDGPEGKHGGAQIIAALKQVEAGRKVEDVALECGVHAHHLRLEVEVRQHGCRKAIPAVGKYGL
jgi:hypothetical protein